MDEPAFSLRRAELVDMSDQFLETPAHLLAFGAQGIEFFRLLSVRPARVFESGLSCSEFLECDLVLEAETMHERDRALDTVFEMTERVGFRLLSGSRHRLLARGDQSRFHLLDDQRELRFIGLGGLRQNFAIQFETGQLHPVHEFAVGEAKVARRGADADNPQRAEITLLALASRVGELERALNGFLRGTVQFAFG